MIEKKKTQSEYTPNSTHLHTDNCLTVNSLERMYDKVIV